MKDPRIQELAKFYGVSYEEAEKNFASFILLEETESLMLGRGEPLIFIATEMFAGVGDAAVHKPTCQEETCGAETHRRDREEDD